MLTKWRPVHANVLVYVFVCCGKGNQEREPFIFYDSSCPIRKLQEFAELILFASNQDTKKVNPTFSPEGGGYPPNVASSKLRTPSHPLTITFRIKVGEDGPSAVALPPPSRAHEVLLGST